MTLDNYLQNIGEQKSQEEKQIVVRKNPKVEELCKIFETKGVESYEDPWDVFETPGPVYNWPYRNYSRLLENVEYKAKDVFDFSLVLKEYEDKKSQVSSSVGFGSLAGIFLSVLVNECKDDDLTIMLNHLTTHIYYLGLCNEKNITVFGDVYNAAEEMQKGKMVINGTPKIALGRNMQGGEIIVNGSSEASLGEEMSGGEIHVKGDAKNDPPVFLNLYGASGTHITPIDIGTYMTGGKIIIYGTAEGDIANSMKNGLIIIKGNANHAHLNMMDGGEIVIEGDVKKISNSCFKGGKIHVYGEIRHITRGKTEIYHQGRRVGHHIFSRTYYNKLRKNNFIRKVFG
ncbi:hypothetical protein HY837_04465 [archaeon]|nr:hypothetical protein [archaeon]